MRLIPFAAVMSLLCALAVSGQDLPLSQLPPDLQRPKPRRLRKIRLSPNLGSQNRQTRRRALMQRARSRRINRDKRVFGVIPNNRTTSGTVPYQPISAGRKIMIGLKDSFDWPPYLTGAAFAGLYQLENSNPSFGQGAAGYSTVGQRRRPIR